jgi:hypothetical protein
MDPKVKEIIGKLLKATEEKTINWMPTARKSEFRLPMEKGSITVDNYVVMDEFGQGDEVVGDIVFLNAKGETVERFGHSADAEPDDYKYLHRLHNAARRNALKIEEQLSVIFQEIDEKVKGSPRSTGGPPPRRPPSDESASPKSTIPPT